jgi:hypothetical protein
MMFHPEANHRSAFLKSSVSAGVFFGNGECNGSVV